VLLGTHAVAMFLTRQRTKPVATMSFMTEMARRTAVEHKSTTRKSLNAAVATMAGDWLHLRDPAKRTNSCFHKDNKAGWISKSLFFK